MAYKQVIVVRNDLNMRKGKMVAQGAHASLAVILNLIRVRKKWGIIGDILRLFRLIKDVEGLNDPRVKAWVEGSFTKICIRVDSEEELLSIHQKAKESGILTALIRDAGKTEFNGVPTYTTVSVGPDDEDKINAITGHLKLL